MKTRNCLLILSLFILSLHSKGQQAKLDSLITASKTAKDTTLVNILSEISVRYCKQGDNPKALSYAKNALENAQKINYRRGIATAYRSYGTTYRNMSDYSKALEYHKKALDISTADNDKKSISASLNNIANIYFIQGNCPKAIETHLKSLKIKEEINDKKGIASSLNGIASVYYTQGNLDMAMTYYNRSMKIRQEIGDKSGMAMILNNIGGIYRDKKEYAKANDYLQKALAIQDSLNETANMSSTMNGIAGNLGFQKNYKDALSYYMKALAIQEKSKDRQGIATTYNNIGNIYINQEDYLQAKDYLDKALMISKMIGSKDLSKEIFLSLTSLNQKTGHFKEALDYQNLYIQAKDSLMNEQTQKSIAAMNSQYESEKQELEITSLEKDKALSNYEINRQRNFIYSFMAFSVLIIALAFALFRGYNAKKKANALLEIQKKEIENQKAIVEEKNKDITDSIKYAKRIQEAILPPESSVSALLPESFILYKPKDIVSGDFYWIEQKEDKVLVAAVDCTGHGVPGALMSVVGYNLLNQAVNEKNISTPNLILNSLNKGVSNTLRQKEEDASVKDGMDISLCAIDKNKKLLEFAAAYNSLYLVRNGEIIETAGDKFPIGIFIGEEMKSFTNHQIQLQTGDLIYLFSDGYADQFGGQYGKKFKYKQLKELLLSIRDKTMKEQHQLLNTAIENWKGSLEQVDDILIIGIRI